MTTNHTTGIRQRHILEQMTRHNGYWPPTWRIKSDHRHIFETLHQRGLIVRAWVGGTYTWKLTQPRQATT